MLFTLRKIQELQLIFSWRHLCLCAFVYPYWEQHCCFLLSWYRNRLSWILSTYTNHTKNSRNYLNIPIMIPNKSSIKKRVIYLLTMMNSITLFVLVGLFLIFFLFDIPLKHLFPFIVIYSFGIITLIMIDPKNTSFHSFPLNHRFAYSVLFITNIAIIVLLFILLNRYSLGQYSFISII